ncbi:hypothetical protein [Actinoplanes friuliensis]|uniref:Uncharacterized protein n=1 Tax=Actinoplanes friuliensis DSM 7358 TaxID=1246995 RepID=U5W0K6_9ACTN|nr:hypothetical protein [Actinoplanes friuliensis]AGZ41520.1 hypothetical protein AFR_16190 [Actinoplanes friuliensis DSM 7358]
MSRFTGPVRGAAVAATVMFAVAVVGVAPAQAGSTPPNTVPPKSSGSGGGGGSSHCVKVFGKKICF